MLDDGRVTFSNVNAAEPVFWRNSVLPEMRYLEEQLNRMFMPRLGYSDLVAQFDASAIEALREDENSRVTRDMQMLDRGVLTINEVRRSRNLADVPWGDTWAKAPGRGGSAQRAEGAASASTPPVAGESLVSANGAGPRV